MNDRAVSLFEKYDVTVESTRKGRGAIIAQTQLGEIALVEYNGSDSHLLSEYALLLTLSDRMKLPVDQILCTKEGLLSCTDYEGKKYIVKKYVEGRECNVYEAVDRKKAAATLARFHSCMRGIDLSLTEPIKCMVEVSESEEDTEGTESLPDVQVEPVMEERVMLSFDQIDPYKMEASDDLASEFDKRTAELIRVRNYIRKLPRKSEFELYFLSVFEKYREQALHARELLSSSTLESLAKRQVQCRMYAHGDCTQHNVVTGRQGTTLLNFERAGAHLQIKDLYLFIRKVSEKNNWSFEIAQDMIQTYDKELGLSQEELQYLYARFIFPEKFWKVANGYLNRRKSVPSKRQLEKLEVLEEKEPVRCSFLHKWVETF